MKTANHGFKNPFAWLRAICCFSLLFVLVGCGESTLPLANWLEKNALKNGTISAGAVRITNYSDPCLVASRQRLTDTLYVMEANMTDANIMPQSYMSNESSFKLGLVLGWAKTEVNSLSLPDLNGTNDLFQAMTNVQPKPTEIEMVGLRMAARKFVESEIEDLNLMSVYPVDCNYYKRYVISLDCTAWVCGKAKAALVLIDLYPYNADIWCHEEANNVYSLNSDINMWNSNGEIKWDATNIKWNGKLSILGRGFDGNSLKHLTPPILLHKADKDAISNYIARLHEWLADSKLCPRIVLVERMEEGEYLISTQGEYSGYGFRGGGALPLGMSASVEAEAEKKNAVKNATVQPCDLAFVAGNSRAGWLFRPSTREQNSMSPKERRLRMVVDIPKGMTKVGIYVHKLFLDSDLQVIPSTDFLNEVANHWLNQWALFQSDSLYETLMENDPALYGLIKTRIRNLLSQGWSEEIVADIP
ncbi:MAG: hypothetical protein WBL85_08390 [Sedimentisphaerales bacterium]